ncbi:CAP domain-containing protein [Roseovarius sp. C7]|uniref:CAP domain-containing protein n=1 Tax=Roseovarius sp. C7 TaxID=3398643 RepID=UPI0039F715D5
MKHALRFLTLAGALMLGACGGGGSPSTNDAPVMAGPISHIPGDISRQALAAVNRYRSDYSQPALRTNGRLAAAAASHAADMAATDGLSHTGSDGGDVADRARAAGYDYCFIAENIAQGPKDIAEALAGWMASPGHRQNMLNPRAREMAMARRGDFWVMVLGERGC